ncbi:hypothetical protein [Hyphomicrobium sp.]|jgi:hypothetical protein|uniref:hypothetical protein n=1 Tax=Hyphomicrobium sp. TaxID=82 RepID=UPI002C6C8E8D|nr:hypothetical protein [Hyphomicrobium sp.]HVZ04416.1 hypothetical protein [Hyphomicrobium sp.]
MSGTDSEMKNSETAIVPVPKVLEAVGHEVRVLADGVNDLQELVSNLVVAGAFSGSNSLYGLQSLDRISQGLDAISDYLGSLSKLSSPNWKIDVAEASKDVKLTEICDRLNGIANEHEPHEGAGDFEDFALTG